MCSISYIWSSFIKVKQWLLGNIKWEIGLGNNMEIGLYTITGFNGDHSFPIMLIKFLHNLGYYYFNQILVPLEICTYFTT